MKKTMLWGFLSGIAVWLPLVLTDAVDEWLLDRSATLSAWTFLLMPVVLLIIYIRHYRNYQPTVKKIAVWMGFYAIAFIPLWVAFYETHGDLIIKQGSRTWMDLNGIELMFYGISAWIGFFVLIPLYHGIAALIHAVRKTQEDR